MTREEAIIQIKSYMPKDEPMNEKDRQAFDMAIKALEQQPCKRIEYGTDGNIYEMSISNGKEYKQEPCGISEEALEGMEIISKAAYEKMVEQVAELERIKVEPCDDTISRQAVLDMCNRLEPTFKGSLLEQGIKSLPPVKPKNDENGFNDSENSENEAVRTTDDLISKQAAIDGLASIAKAKAKSDAQKSMMGRSMYFIEHLPPVSPARLKGKWINQHVIHAGYSTDFKVCSECRYAFSYDAETGISEANFCPACGAKMEGESK